MGKVILQFNPERKIAGKADFFQRKAIGFVLRRVGGADRMLAPYLAATQVLAVAARARKAPQPPFRSLPVQG